MIRILYLQDLTGWGLIRKILNVKGYDVFEVWNVPDALQIAREKPPDLLLVDCVDMFAVIEQLNHIPELAYLPLIVLTTPLASECYEHLAELGVNQVIERPVSIETLIQEIENYLP